MLRNRRELDLSVRVTNINKTCRVLYITSFPGLHSDVLHSFLHDPDRPVLSNKLACTPAALSDDDLKMILR